MNNKLLSTLIIIILFAGTFILFAKVVYAKGLNFFYTNKNNIIVTLKNDADIEKSKRTISEIPQIKIIKITDRDKEWSKMVNKMDLPNMQNPFKNEFTIHTKKKANINEIYNKLKDMDFVENVKYVSETESLEKQK